MPQPLVFGLEPLVGPLYPFLKLSSECDALANATPAERERIEAMGRCAAFAFLDDPDFEPPDEIPDLSE
jgi:hypothetical protein